MPLYRPSELRQFLDSLGIAPKKVLSQNFLIDGNIVNKILESSKVQPQEVVLEIGPGPGVLTEALLKKGAIVMAVERDEALAAALHQLDGAKKNLHVYAADILTFPIEEAVSPLLFPGQKIKVIANLPYHLTSIIIAKLVQMGHLISSLTLMVQDEVARRFTAKAKASGYSSFSLFLQFYSDVRYAFSVSHHCFFPKPKVKSAVVVLELKKPLLVSDVDHFFLMTRTAFQQRRKMMRSSLCGIYEPQVVENCLTAIGCSSESRPEELSVEQFVQFFHKIAKQSNDSESLL